jgi:hypothetical protein
VLRPFEQPGETGRTMIGWRGYELTDIRIWVGYAPERECDRIYVLCLEESK